MKSFFRSIATCSSVSVEPAMTVAGTNNPDDNNIENTVQVDLGQEHKNYSPVPTCPNSGSDCSTESQGCSGSGNAAVSKAVSITSSSSSTIICRICQDADKKENLKTLCQCTGSIAKYHVSCLEKWLSVSNTDICELCHEHFTTRRKPKPFSEWLIWVHRTSQCRYIYGDITCLLILTPLVLVSVALCGEGACYYFSRDQLLIATGLLGLCVFLAFLYLLWVALSVRYHVHRWRKWRKENQVVQVVVPETKFKEKHRQPNQQQETVV